MAEEYVPIFEDADFDALLDSLCDTPLQPPSFSLPTPSHMSEKSTQAVPRKESSVLKTLLRTPSLQNVKESSLPKNRNANNALTSSGSAENLPSASKTNSKRNEENSILTTFRKNDPKKFQDLENRFTDPKITKTRECQVLKSLQKRILEDMQQSEIIVNYLADKYDNEPERKRVKFSSLH